MKNKLSKKTNNKIGKTNNKWYKVSKKVNKKLRRTFKSRNKADFHNHNQRSKTTIIMLLNKLLFNKIIEAK